MRNKTSSAHYGVPFLQCIVVICVALLIRLWGYGLYVVPTGSMETTMLVGELFFANKYTYIFNNPRSGDIVVFNDPLFEYDSNHCISCVQRYIYGPSHWAKRIVGVPGDHVQGVVRNGKAVVYVNGVIIKEYYVNSYPLINLTDAQDSNYKSYDPTKSFDQQPWYSIDVDAVVCGADGKPVVRFQEPVASNTAHVMKVREYWDGSDEFDIHLGANQYWVMGDNRSNSHDSRSFGPIERDYIQARIAYRIFSIDYEISWSLLFDFLLHPVTMYTAIRWNRCMQTLC